MVTCSFLKDDGQGCKAPARTGSDFCRHHQPAPVVREPLPHFGHDDHEWEEQMAAALRHAQLRNVAKPALEVQREKPTYQCPEQDPEFWNDYSSQEIHNYIIRETGGRVEIPLHFSHEQMVAHAVEVYE